MLSLNYRDGRPIYEQVRDGLRHLVVTGAMEPGEKLPSVRALAAALSINPNTIQRAYEALESEGYLNIETGRGAFAAAGRDVNAARRETLLKQLDAACAELFFLGMTPAELAARVSNAAGGAGAPSPQPDGGWQGGKNDGERCVR